MSLQYTDGINLMGQSNMSALLQGLIANAMAPEVFVAGAAVGGARLANDTWLSLAEPWTRAAYYTSLIARHNEAKYKRLVSVFFQGESDTESDPLSLAHAAKVAAFHAFLAADLVASGGSLLEVILLPWNTSVGGGTGYTNVRAGLQAYVAASPSTRVAIDTASWGRSGDNVHLTPAQVAANAPTIIAAINAFLTRVAATEGGSSGGGGGGGGGATNLSCSTSTTTAIIASDTGTDATIPPATGSAAGVMTAAQAAKLSGIADNATANATDAQLRDRATHTGTQAISTVTGLQTALDGKAAGSHTHALSDLTASGATSGQVATWNGTAWAPATPSGGGSSPTTTRGDLIRRASSADERLALGAMHRSVMSDSTDPVWGVTSEWFAGVVHGMYYVGSSATPSTFNTSGAPSAQGTTARVAATSTVAAHASATSTATTGSLAGVNSSAAVHTSRAFEAVIYGGIDSLATTRFFAGFFGNVNTMGANDSPSGTTCIAVRYSSAAGDTNWQLVTSNGATATVQATSIPVTTGIHKFTIRSSGSSSMKFWVDDVYAGEVTTTLPAAYIAMGVIGATLANVAIIVRHIQSYCIEPL